MSWKRYSEFRWWELEFRKWHRILVYSSIDSGHYNDKCWRKNGGWTRERHIGGSWGVGGQMGASLCAEWAHFDWVVKGGCSELFSTREIQVYKVFLPGLSPEDSWCASAYHSFFEGGRVWVQTQNSIWKGNIGGNTPTPQGRGASTSEGSDGCIPAQAGAVSKPLDGRRFWFWFYHGHFNYFILS